MRNMIRHHNPAEPRCWASPASRTVRGGSSRASGTLTEGDGTKVSQSQSMREVCRGTQHSCSVRNTSARLTFIPQQHPPAAGGVLALDVQNSPALASQDDRRSAMGCPAQPAQLSPCCCWAAARRAAARPAAHVWSDGQPHHVHNPASGQSMVTLAGC